MGDHRLADVNRDAVLRALRHLPSEQDLTLIVLKGHLLVEQQLYDIVRCRVLDPAPIEEAKLRFWQLARLARAMVGAEAPSELWLSIDQLNRLRNELAHRLGSQEIEALADRLIQAMPLPFEIPPAFSSTLADRVKASIAYMCGSLMRFTSTDGQGTA